ncbi:MAG: type II toxin-antitoxin system VapC family toxin [Bacteroidales bacterium]
MEKGLVLCDTNIIIEFYKDNSTVIDQLKRIGSEKLVISSVTAAELIAGAFNSEELNIIIKDIEKLSVIHLDKQISRIFIELMRRFNLSHNLGIPDALIASTCLRYNLPLYTLNRKDFRYIPDVKLFN